MDNSISDFSDEMGRLAKYCIKTAKEKFDLDLDYSNPSIQAVETILEKLYWGLSNRSEIEGGLIYNIASIWSAYLGEFMIRKWSGKWIIKGSQKLVSINNIDFAPITFVYNKIIGREKETVSDYLYDVNRRVQSEIDDKSRDELFSLKNEQEGDKIEEVQPNTELSKSKSPYLRLRVITTVVIIILISISIYLLINNGEYLTTALLSVASPTSTPTFLNIEVQSPSPTITTLPTYTPRPSITPHPSRTPYPTRTPTLTYTLIPTSTATKRRATDIPVNTPTHIPVVPRDTQVLPTLPVIPSPTSVAVSIVSCSVNPSTIDPGRISILIFSAQFSAPGYGFRVELNPQYPGASGCTAIDDNRDGTASCNGVSGLLPSSTSVSVTFMSASGNCSTVYTAP